MINLSNRQWKQFKVGNIFTIRGGKDYPKKNQTKGDLPFIGASSMNNGVVDFLNDESNTPNAIYKNAISVNRTGSVGYCFYHKYTAYYQGRVRVLVRNNLNEPMALFLCTCIRQQHYQFNYGFGLGTNHLKKMRVNLPVDSRGQPDWQFMSDYMKQIRTKISSQYVHNQIHHSRYSLNDHNWKQFKIKNLFYIERGKRIPKRSRHQGKVPFVGASTVNNGLTDNIDNNGVKAGYHKDVIGVNYNGDPCYAFYHPYLAYFCDDVMALYRKRLNVPEGLFITTCIRQQKDQFNYGFKLKMNRLKDLKLNLPITSSGQPDWQFMSNYMKSMVK